MFAVLFLLLKFTIHGFSLDYSRVDFLTFCLKKIGLFRANSFHLLSVVLVFAGFFNNDPRE